MRRISLGIAARARRARLGLPVVAALVAGCAGTTPTQQANLCAVLDQHPRWYEYARRSHERWGTPPHVLMAFVKQESSYRADARAPRKRILGVPLWRVSSAKGYAQALDGTWSDYLDQTRGGFLKSRADMEDALDFIGWYNDASHRRLGISKWDPERLYLAYHEGHAGYARGTHRGKRKLQTVAARVATQAREYGAQLKRCEARLRCRARDRAGPLCS